MKFTLASTATGCTISKVEFHQSTLFPIPMGAGDVTALLSALLADPEKREVEQGPVLIVRTEKGVSIRTRDGTFDLPWSHLFAIEGALNV
jgi:hypothetical protein